MTEWVQDILMSGGLGTLALLVLAENLFPPIPSEVILPLAGFLVFEGELGFVPAVVASTAGSLAGALILYAIARLGGRPLLLRYGRVLRLDDERLDRADAWFDRHGPKIVLFGRLLPGVRSLVSVPAGLSEMPVRLFVVLTTIGSLVWNAALIGAGWALGESWEDVTALVEQADVLLVVAAVATLVIGVVTHRRRRATTRRA